ncbi:hypothetical protein ABPG75_009757 [Micractinium tetrahymenae]
MVQAYEPAPLEFFRPATLEDLDRITALEAAGYPPDEAASRERLEYRLKHAGAQFLAAVCPAAAAEDGRLEVIGFVCGTLSCADKLTEESMGAHEPEGDLLAIHSVCVDAAHRRGGVASRLLRAYLSYVQGTTPGLREVRLICKERLIPLYAGVGFQMVGPSDVVHGKDPWFEMRWALGGEEQEEEQEEQRQGGGEEQG